MSLWTFDPVKLPDTVFPVAPVTIYDGQGRVTGILPADEFRRLHPHSYRADAAHQNRPPKPKKLPVPVVCPKCLGPMTPSGCWGCGNPLAQVRERYAARRTA